MRSERSIWSISDHHFKCGIAPQNRKVHLRANFSSTRNEYKICSNGRSIAHTLPAHNAFYLSVESKPEVNKRTFCEIKKKKKSKFQNLWHRTIERWPPHFSHVGCLCVFVCVYVTFSACELSKLKSENIFHVFFSLLSSVSSSLTSFLLFIRCFLLCPRIDSVQTAQTTQRTVQKIETVSSITTKYNACYLNWFLRIRIGCASAVCSVH